MLELLSIVFGAPLCQAWLLVGLVVGGICGLLWQERPRKIFLTTALVVVPPLITLPFLATMYNSHSGFLSQTAIIVSIAYVMTGFVAFCIAWIPGVTLGYFLARGIDRGEKDSA